MNEKKTPNPKIPLKEMLGAIPGLFGIRLEEEPKYDVLQKDGPIEIRKYARMLTSRTSIHSDHDKAVNEGFSRLAAYIFGGNNKQSQMSMTTPVLQEKKSGSWLISFVIPAKFDLKTVPKPNDERIELITIPEKTVAVYRYSGNNDPDSMKKAQAEIEKWLATSNFRKVSEVSWAQYDQPFAIPFLKRNEALMTIEPKH